VVQYNNLHGYLTKFDFLLDFPFIMSY